GDIDVERKLTALKEEMGLLPAGAEEHHGPDVVHEAEIIEDEGEAGEGEEEAGDEEDEQEEKN
ncbi:MAG: hypothetical protein GWO40_05070, partial [Gammaproteobacteria bacterium]|nr:hypothetical protein [Gemmatimonadota bacterium]NIU03659.1 hypothetical protein [Gammaproteobacteria bacterium]NIV51011.1 hypothetical protein [Gammaproteobacteria bacterium]NIX84933.1 hypothetical protein [Gammaproteobacteria bacterium]NIY44144.1 hypothetical protein [Gemmatimonadota bacterium]